ncbi:MULTISPECIES: hypothetical protein [Aurantimonas]|uniref:hypothetical protein n=1 Tax=Aurantimonas TaxID=182269 RepID=UPI0035115FAB
MDLADDQMAAAMHGAPHEVRWSFIERPTGPQPLPGWCKGAQIFWLDGYGNSPDVRLKVIGEARDWPEKRFRREGNRYIAESGDGRVEQYAHDGGVSMVKLRRWRSEDGSLRTWRRSGPEWAEAGSKAIGRMVVDGNLVEYGNEPGEWVEVDLLATTKQQGFGGAEIPIKMEDGSDLVLRGPWHVGAPQGFVETAYVDVGKPVAPYYSKRPWHQRTGMGGLYLREDLFIRIMSRFAAHIPLVRVKHLYGWRVEPIKPEWDAPKAIIYDREWQAKAAAREALKREVA